ncbi:MAG: hypothetical protein AAF806_11745 [Bacteroidota bacterium]
MQEQQQHFEQLQEWEKIAKALGFSTQMYRTEAPLNGIVLHIILAEDQAKRSSGINILYIPSEEGKSLHSVSLVQLFAAVPFKVEQNTQNSMIDFLYQLNNQIPVGHFSIGETGAPYYRYVLAMPKNQSLDLDYLRQLILLIQHQIDRTFPLLEAVSKGRLTPVEALSKLS